MLILHVEHRILQYVRPEHLVFSLENHRHVKSPINLPNQDVIADLARFINCHLVLNSFFFDNILQQTKVIWIGPKNLEKCQTIEILEYGLSVDLVYVQVALFFALDLLYVHHINGCECAEEFFVNGLSLWRED